MDTITIGDQKVTRFILGTNPVSGFSHQSVERDKAMMHYFTTARVKELFRQAESLGVQNVIARSDHFVMRMLMEYWDEGGTIRWIAQTCPELGSAERGVQNAIRGGAKACFVHGGWMDFLLAQGRIDEVKKAIDMIREHGIPAGVAGHNPAIFSWAEENLKLEFYMCSYYNPTERSKAAEHKAGLEERFVPEDRDAMAKTIAGLGRPVIHYKVLAAGRNKPDEAFAYVAKNLRPGDAVCVGSFPGNNPNELADTLSAFEKTLKKS